MNDDDDEKRKFLSSDEVEMAPIVLLFCSMLCSSDTVKWRKVSLASWLDFGRCLTRFEILLTITLCVPTQVWSIISLLLTPCHTISFLLFVRIELTWNKALSSVNPCSTANGTDQWLPWAIIIRKLQMQNVKLSLEWVDGKPFHFKVYAAHCK
jgi:hypothetical protein